ncbi:MAG TPA: hypothetical protein VL357_03080 [Rariglobus sp.]|jgi:hypothetical protein|nr:hypothetical protein [Rariglobus sp.]
MKTKSKACALVATMLLSSLLTGCVTGSSAPKASLQIYQPRVLQLPAGVPIQSKAGIYIPQVDEVWHSAAAYGELENQLINTAAALSQERNAIQK